MLFSDQGSVGKGYSGLLVVKTPALDDSGVSHGVEHLVFRRSAQFAQAESLFQLTALTDLTINASTEHDVTYYHCHSMCQQTFLLGLDYLWRGLTSPQFLASDFDQEIYADGGYGVIYRELLTQPLLNDEFQYGGTANLIGELTMADLKRYHQQYYRVDNMVLITDNIQDLPWSKTVKVKQQDGLNSLSVKGKTSVNIGRLMAYYQGLSEPVKVENNTEQVEPIAITQPVISDPKALTATPNVLIKQLQWFKMSVSHFTQRPLPKLFGDLLVLALTQKNKQLASASNDSSNFSSSSSSSSGVTVFDNHHFLSVNHIAIADQELAMVASFIIGAAPCFLAPRIQGHCYAIAVQYLACHQSLVCYSAFDISPHLRGKTVKAALQTLAQDLPFIEQTLALAKIKLGGSLQTSISTTAVAKFITSLS